MEDSDRTVNVSQKSTQFDLMMKEKKALASKLKIKLIKEQKIVQDNTRKLQKDNQKEEH